MVEWIDTHAHLYAAEFDADREEMVQRAKETGITHILLPNIDIQSFEVMHKLYDLDTQLFRMMMGLHPCSVQPGYERFLNQIEEELKTNRYIAVGEIGMDLYWDKSTKNIQEDAFRKQCMMAIQFDLPIAVHSRESTSELIGILQSMKQVPRGVFHCFSGSIEEARILMDMGFYLGVGGVVSFKNSGLREVLAEIGVKRLVLETDAPYLAPVPHRGKRNESSYIPIIAAEIAKSCGMGLEDVSRITTQNARTLFRL